MIREPGQTGYQKQETALGSVLRAVFFMGSAFRAILNVGGRE